MRKKDGIRITSVYRMLAIAALVVIIPLYLLGLYIYTTGVNSVRNEISSSMISQTAFFLDNFQNDITVVRQLQYDCLNDENIRHLSTMNEVMDTYEEIRACTRLQQRLTSIRSSSSYVKDVTAYIPAIAKKVSAINGVDDIAVQDQGFVQRMITAIGNSQICYMNEGIFTSAAYPMSYSANKKMPMYIIIVELSKEDIYKALQYFSGFGGNGMVLMNYSTHEVLAAVGDDMPGRQIKTLVGQDDFPADSESFTSSVGSRKYFFTYKVSDKLNLALFKYVPEETVFESLKNYKIWMLALSFLSILVLGVFALLTVIYMHKPLVKLVNGFQVVEKGNLNVSIEHHHNDEFMYLYRRFNEMVFNLNLLIEKEYRQKMVLQLAELRQLQLQIDPHFLYNSFFILYSMINEEKYDSMARLCKLLGVYYQFITQDPAKDVTLGQEVEHAWVYADIQSIRFSSRITVNFMDLPEQFKRLPVPRLILQPLIENAFKHGFKNKKKDGLITVHFSHNESKLCIDVDDNGEGMDPEKLDSLQKAIAGDDNGEGVGLTNVHRRLKLKFGDGGLQLYHADSGGMKVRIEIPFDEKTMSMN